MILRPSCLGIVALVLVPGTAGAAGFRVPTLGQALQSGGNLTVPAAWAGIWADSDTTHGCSDEIVTETSFSKDTLCTGDGYSEDIDGFILDCDGTVTDTEANITCSGTSQIKEGCVVQFSLVIAATRDGDQIFAETTITTTFDPPLCASLVDECEVRETTGVRTGLEPPDCALTPVQPRSWGSVKARYR